MKRLAVLGVLFLALSLAVASVSAYDSTERETITITSGTTDFSFSEGDSGNTDYSFSVMIPCSFTELADMTDPIVTINSTNASGLTYSIIVNDVVVINNASISGINVHEREDSVIADNMADNTTSGLIINITTNNTDNEVDVYLEGNDVALSQDGPSPVTEEDNENPAIDEWWEVTDNITLPNGLGYDLTDLDILIHYPSCSDEEDEWLNDTTILDGETFYHDFVFDKKIEIEEDDIEASTGQVIIEVDDDNKVIDATWEVEYGKDHHKYYDYFTSLDESSLTIEVGEEEEDGDIDWDELDEDDWAINDGVIEIDSIDISEDENLVKFSWQSQSIGDGGDSGGEIPTEEGNILEQESISGIPNWSLLAIIGVVIIAFFAIYRIEKK